MTILTLRTIEINPGVEVVNKLTDFNNLSAESLKANVFNKHFKVLIEYVQKYLLCKLFSVR